MWKQTQGFSINISAEIAIPVKRNQKGIQCDMCDVWYHARCCIMNDHIYNSLANSIWICTSCGLPNFSTSIFDSIHSINTSNSFQPLAESITESNSSGFIDTSIGMPVSTSSPRARRSKQQSPSILTVNCQSILAKNEDLAQLAADCKPDIIIGTETWLTKKS